MKYAIVLILGTILGISLTWHYASPSAVKEVRGNAQSDISQKSTDLRRGAAKVISPDSK